MSLALLAAIALLASPLDESWLEVSELGWSGTLSVSMGGAVSLSTTPRDQIERTKIGERGAVRSRAGDGCNWCTYGFVRASEDEVVWDSIASCTTASCALKPEKFK